MTTFWAMLLKPLVFLATFGLIVAPLTWLLFKVIPHGRLKVFLFRVRTGPQASTRDKVVITAWVVLFYAAFFALVIFLDS